MKKEFQLSDRREFLADGLRSAALLTALATGRSQAADRPAPSNPFAYDVSRQSKTDPKLIAYEEVARWKCPHPEPKRLAVAPDQRIFVCSGNYVTALDSAGQSGLEIALPEAARCVAVAKDGTIYAGLRDHLEVFDAKGQRRAVWDSPGKKAWFTGLAVGENDVFAADSGNRVLLRYDKSGKLASRIGEKNKERDIPGFILPSPYLDVEISRDGLLRVNNPGRHRVEAYTLAGDFAGAWGQPTMGIAGFCGCCNPIGLALLPDGRFVTCEKGLPRVKIYGADGAFESVVAGTESFSENAKACTDLNDCTRGGMDAAVLADGRIAILDFIAADIRVMKAKG
jgi:sugar lactone lactonase YvrE